MKKHPAHLDVRRVAAAAALLCAGSAHSLTIDTGVPDLSLSWNNTVKASTAWRLTAPSPALTQLSANGANANQNDGDMNFGKGPVSQRMDLFSELDARYGDFGVRLSAAGWYDAVYHRSNDNDGTQRVNSSGPYNEFAAGTRDLHGSKAEVLDAFVSGRWSVGEGVVSVRAGQHAVLWGESLFFGANGIAGGMAPMDLVKLLSLPGTPFKEIIRPEPQLSGQVQFDGEWSAAAFAKSHWERSRINAAGSYLSFFDTVDAGGERMYIGAPGNWFSRGADIEPGAPEGGLQVKWRPEGYGVDLGLAALQYNDRTPQFYLRPPTIAAFGSPPNTGQIGQYQIAFAEKVRLVGLSANTTLDRVNVGAEVSVRWNAPLTNGAQTAPAFVPADNDDNARYPVGRTAHVQVSWMASLPPSWLANEADLLGEIAWNRALSVTRNPAAVDPNTDRDAIALRMIFVPSYRQVLPGLDLSVPIGLAYAPSGRSRAVSNFAIHKGGDFSVGLTGSYLDSWRFGATYVHYYGPEGGFLDSANHLSFKQYLRDRDTLSMYLSLAF